MSKIFISIASYCDSRLADTIADALDKADDPSRLVFGVVEQREHEHRLVISPEWSNIIRYVGVDPQESRGACWARALCMSLYAGENFFFQIDSHMLFDKGWDNLLIRSLMEYRRYSNKVIISSYPLAFEVDNGVVTFPPLKDLNIIHVVAPDTTFVPETYNLSFSGVATPNMPPTKAIALGAGCLFTTGNFVNDIPYDPYFYFQGEEQALMLRAYTHGWDVYHMPFLPIRHLYNTDQDACYRPRHWAKGIDEKRKERWWEIDKQSKKRLELLVKGRNLGVYSLGTTRTVKDFISFSGIDYETKTVLPKAYTVHR